MNRCLQAVFLRIVAGSCAWVVLGAPALGQIATPQMKASEVAPCRPNMPQRMVSLPGMFMVHVVCDHVLFEIPIKMLDRDMLLNTEFAALSTGSDYVAPGSVVDSRVVRWVRRGNKVYLEDVRYEMWAPNMPNLQRGVEAGIVAHRDPCVRCGGRRRRRRPDHRRDRPCSPPTCPTGSGRSSSSTSA